MERPVVGTTPPSLLAAFASFIQASLPRAGCCSLVESIIPMIVTILKPLPNFISYRTEQKGAKAPNVGKTRGNLPLDMVSKTDVAHPFSSISSSSMLLRLLCSPMTALIAAGVCFAPHGDAPPAQQILRKHHPTRP